MCVKLSFTYKTCAVYFIGLLLIGLPIITIAQEGYKAPLANSATAKYEYENSHYSSTDYKRSSVSINIPVNNKTDLATIKSIISTADMTDDEYYDNFKNARNAEWIRNGVNPKTDLYWEEYKANSIRNEWPTKFPDKKDFELGYATVKHHDRMGIIDSTGRIVIPIIWSQTSLFQDGLAVVTAPGWPSKSGFVDKTNTLVIPLKYDRAYGFHEGLATVMLGKKWGFINTNDIPVTAFDYDGIGWSYRGFTIVERKKKFGAIDKSGKEVIPTKYQTVSQDYAQPIFYYKYKDKWGAFNENGTSVIEPIYESQFYFKGDKAEVTLKDRKFYIDITGHEVPAL